MRVRQRLGEFIAVGRFEPQRPPERTGATAEQPGRGRALFRRTLHGESSESAAPTAGALRLADRNAPDQRMATVAADLVPRAPDDRAVLVTVDPEPHARRIQPAQREIDLPQ